VTPYLREVKPEDEAFILQVRNSEDVRIWSKNQEIISEMEHARWLGAQLYDVKALLWIIEDENQPLGYIRGKEIEKRTWKLSFALASKARGRGYGYLALQQACKLLIESHQAQRLVAEVISANSVGLHLLKKTGFKNRGKKLEADMDIENFEWSLECFDHNGWLAHFFFEAP